MYIYIYISVCVCVRMCVCMYITQCFPTIDIIDCTLHVVKPIAPLLWGEEGMACPFHSTVDVLRSQISPLGDDFQPRAAWCRVLCFEIVKKMEIDGCLDEIITNHHQKWKAFSSQIITDHHTSTIIVIYCYLLFGSDVSPLCTRSVFSPSCFWLSQHRPGLGRFSGIVSWGAWCTGGFGRPRNPNPAMNEGVRIDHPNFHIIYSNNIHE